MRVSKITVKQLFNTFDHSIPLNLDGRMTIIHGLNGLGKTTLLRMVKSLCSSRFAELQAVPFSEMRLDFDDNTSVVVYKGGDDEKSDQTKKRNRLTIKYLKSGIEADQYKPPAQLDPSTISFPLEWLEHHIPGLERLGSNTWRYMATREVMSLEEQGLRITSRLDCCQDLDFVKGSSVGLAWQ